MVFQPPFETYAHQSQSGFITSPRWWVFLGYINPTKLGRSMFTFQPSWWCSTHLKCMLVEFGSFPQGSGVKNKNYMKPAQKTCSTPPAHCIRESFTQKTSSICFSLRSLGGWNLLRTRHVYQIAICAVEEVNSFGFIAFSFRSEMLISCHDTKTLSGLSFHLPPKKTKIKTIQNNDAF